MIKLPATKHAKTRDILQFMLDGDLYYIKANKIIVRALKTEDGSYALTEVLTGAILALLKNQKFQKLKRTTVYVAPFVVPLPN